MVFLAKDVMGYKKQILSLVEEEFVYNTVFLMWTTILNLKEKYKSEESPKRFFGSPFLVVRILFSYDTVV